MADVEKRLEAMALCEYPVVHSVNTHTLKYGELTRHAEGKQRMVLVIAGELNIATNVMRVYVYV